MPRYYFRLRDMLGDLEDHDGADLPDEAAARCEAVRLAHTITVREPDKMKTSGPWRLEITDGRHVLFVVDWTCRVWPIGD